MNKQDILDNISTSQVTPEIIARAIVYGTADRYTLSMDECVSTGSLSLLKRQQVNELVARYKSEKITEEKKAKEKEEADRLIADIRANRNKYKPDYLIRRLSEDQLRGLCSEFEIDYNRVLNYNESRLEFNVIPEDSSDIPEGFTDIFFWGIPSSGKTSALAAILRTMDENYTMANASISKQFGSTYRTSLINIFNNGGYLPGANQKDRTQYMPFMLKRRKGNDNYRKLSFFELSGELFERFYEIVNHTSVLTDESRALVDKAFITLDLLLNNSNQKIHFFFIDYDKETQSSMNNNITQSQYLNAATHYFSNSLKLFKKKTDAVYVIVTKSDAIKTNNDSGNERTQLAGEFLRDRVGGFIDMLRHLCKQNHVEFKAKIFSIGDVYFKSICNLNKQYAINIIEELLTRVRPATENKFIKHIDK
jgi:hypothetical protein